MSLCLVHIPMFGQEEEEEKKKGEERVVKGKNEEFGEWTGLRRRDEAQRV